MTDQIPTPPAPKRRGRPPKPRPIEQPLPQAIHEAVRNMPENEVALPPPPPPPPIVTPPVNKPASRSSIPLNSGTVIQINKGVHRGRLVQVGEIEGTTVYWYALREGFEPEVGSVGQGEFIALTALQPGMVALREFKKPESAPDWNK